MIHTEMLHIMDLYSEELRLNSCNSDTQISKSYFSGMFAAFLGGYFCFGHC